MVILCAIVVVIVVVVIVVVYIKLSLLNDNFPI